MEFMKKYWFYMLAAIVAAGLLYHTWTLPDGVISTAPPLAGKTHYSASDNIPLREPQEEQANTGLNARNGSTTKVIAANDGKPVEIIIKDGRRGSDGENDLGNNATSMVTFFHGVLGAAEYIAKLALYSVMIGFFFLLITGQVNWRSWFGGGGRGGRFAPNQSGGGDAQGIADKVFGQWVDPTTIKINGFDDVAGVPEAISQFRKLKRQIVEQAEAVNKIRTEEEAKKVKEKEKNKSKSLVVTAAELMDRLQSSMKKSKFGGKLPQCILLEGPPGTGKTLLITALAKECGVQVFVISGSDFVEMFVGLGANRVREMFSDARDKRPCMIFIDEIDAVGRARTGGPGSHPEADQTLNQILVELQGLNTGNQNFGLWILAATNRVDILDKALLRPGRFTWKIKVDPPNLDGRVAILNVHAKKREVPLAKSVDFPSIASVLAGLTGADLENVVNETALYAEELAEAEAEKLRAQGVLPAEIEGLIKSHRQSGRLLRGITASSDGSQDGDYPNF